MIPIVLHVIIGRARCVCGIKVVSLEMNVRLFEGTSPMPCMFHLDHDQPSFSMVFQEAHLRGTLIHSELQFRSYELFGQVDDERVTSFADLLLPTSATDQHSIAVPLFIDPWDIHLRPIPTQEIQSLAPHHIRSGAITNI